MGDGLIEDSTDALHRSASVRCKGRAAPVRAGGGLATGTSDGLAAVRAEGRSSDATVGVNQWPRSQPVLTCSTFTASSRARPGRSAQSGFRARGGHDQAATEQRGKARGR
jgi:hypothetical protein